MSRGGKQPGAGRPPLQGERMREHRITLPRETAEYIRSQAEGNLSAGIRRLAEENKMMIETTEVEAPPAPEWVNTDAGRWAWKTLLWWRVDATGAKMRAYRRFLLREAQGRYDHLTGMEDLSDEVL
jgi:hypothetical protein